MTSIGIRRLLPSDSLEDLTALLHRAFAPLGQQGIACTCVDQSVETTRRRARLGDCFVAVCGGKVVGTITLHGTEWASPIRRYRDPAVASLHQFAVDPEHQRQGIGHGLLRTAENWARSRQYHELALDTPAAAEQLRDFYGRCGFKLADVARLAGKPYLSVILSKSLDRTAFAPGPAFWPARHPAEWAWLHRAERR
ncbi:GNAT family N-acetyltransferase [Sphaerotilaceae bacterium SBD11-9]